MSRHVVDAVRAGGSLAIDPKTHDASLHRELAERALAWDEDETTLAIEAAEALLRRGRGPEDASSVAHLPRDVAAVFIGPGIDGETLRVALDLAAPPTFADDPMGAAMAAQGRALAIGAPPGTASVIAAIVGEGAGTPPAAPRDISPPPRLVSALRAAQQSRTLSPPEPIPDSPMGAYVPWGTWTEDLPARLRLIAQSCKACAHVQYPPRATCVKCRGTAFEDMSLPREARVYAATRIGPGGAPSEFALEQTQVGAYWVAIVEWEGPAERSEAGGPRETSRGRSHGGVEWPAHRVRVAARLAGFDEDDAPRIGDPVDAVVRRLFEQEGRVRYGVKFLRRRA